MTSVVFLEAWRRRRTILVDGVSALPLLLGVANNVVRNARAPASAKDGKSVDLSALHVAADDTR